MIRSELIDQVAKHANERAQQIIADNSAQRELQERRAEAAQAMKDMSAAFAGPVMLDLVRRRVLGEELKQDDWAALVMEDPEGVLPDEIDPEQPDDGRFTLVMDVNVGGVRNGTYGDFRIKDVLPTEDAGEPQEVAAVTIRTSWQLADPTAQNNWYDDGPTEYYGPTSQGLVEAMTMPISAPPTFDEREAVDALVLAVAEQRKTFADTLAMFTELRDGVSFQAPTDELVGEDEQHAAPFAAAPVAA